MVTMKIRGLNKVSSKGKTYYYHRKTQTRIKFTFGTAAFLEEVERLDRLLEKNAGDTSVGTLGHLIRQYRSSPEFQALAPRTKTDYQKVFDFLQPLHTCPISQIDAKFILGIRDKAFRKHKTRFANYVLQVLRLLFSWGVPRGLASSNPARGLQKIKSPKGIPKKNRSWKKQELEAALSEAPTHLKTAIVLGAYCGLREGDMIRFPHSGYDGQSIKFVQRKTGEEVWLPVATIAKTILDQAPKHCPIMVTGQRGRPYTESGFRAVFFRYIKSLERAGKIGSGLTFHGLRHTAGTYLADAGCDTRDIAAVLGHATEKMAEHYTRGSDRRRRAIRAIAKLENTRE